MDYQEKINRLTNEDFFAFFDMMHAEPRWVNSAGKRSIQLLGICHHGGSHSAVFDPTTLKVTCFSACGGGMLFHTWVKRVLGLENPQEAKDYIEEWIEDKQIDLASRSSRDLSEFVYEERKFEPEHIEPLPGIPQEIIDKLYSEFDTTYETLNRLVWHTKDGIDTEQLQRFDVAYFPERKTIILPHHNINGEIVGMYERSFLPLRKEIKKEFPDTPYHQLCKLPRAKYVPLLKMGEFADDGSEKTSWSFPNTKNLYGLHFAKDAIAESGKAIIFEGAKSVMLAHQYGYPYAVASHTFGANPKHISMLIECGAKEIILAFDKQYEVIGDDDMQWYLYEKKTRDLAKLVKDYVDVSRIIDFEDTPLIGYKDAPIDKGKVSFEKLFEQREILVKDHEYQIERKRMEVKKGLARIAKKKVVHTEEGVGEFKI